MASPTSPLRGSFDYDIVTPEVTAEEANRASFGYGGGFADELGMGLRRAATGFSTRSLASGALEAELAGDQAQTARLLADRERLQRSGAGMEAATPEFTGIRSAGDAVDWFGSTLGEGVPSMLPTAAAALASRAAFGRVLGAGGAAATGALPTSYSQLRSGEIDTQYSDPGLMQASAEERSRVATQTALGGAALEALVPGRIAAGMVRGRVGRAALEEGIPEAFTEAGQSAISQVGQMQLDPTREFSTEDLINSGAAGFGVGTAVGAGARLLTPAPAAPRSGALPDPSQPALPPPDTGPAPVPPMGGGAAWTKATEAADFVTSTVNRMREAAATAQTPSDFLRTVFSSPADEAAADLRPDVEDPSVLGAPDPAEALQRRDAERVQRAAGFAEQLLNDPATPTSVRQRVESFGGDFSDPSARDYVTRNLVALRGGEKLANTVAGLVDAAKEFGAQATELGAGVAAGAKDLGAKARESIDKSMEAATDRIVRKNLQDATPAEQATFNKLIFDNLTDEAKANSEVRTRLPEIANSLLAFAGRTGELTRTDLKALLRVQDAMEMFRDPDAVAAQLVQYAGLPRLEDSFLSRVKAVSSARQDVNQPNSFLYASLTEEAKDTMRQPQLKQLARLVDEFAVADADGTRGEQLLTGLAAAFGSTENAKAVLDYYQQQNTAALSLAPGTAAARTGDATYEDAASVAEWGGLEESDGPAQEYGFRSGAAKRPFRKFAGEKLSSGKTRREAVRAVTDARGVEDMNYSYVDYADYLREQGVPPEQGVQQMLADIDARIAEHEGRKGEDRSEMINVLRGERRMLEEEVAKSGPAAALNKLYEVTARAARASEDLTATDDDLRAMKRGVKKPDLRGLTDKQAERAIKSHSETLVTFEGPDGKRLVLSASSMVKAQGSKRQARGGTQNPKVQTDRDTLKDAIAAVVARGYKLVTDPRSIKLDPDGPAALDGRTRERREALADSMEAAGGMTQRLAELRAELRTKVQAVQDAIDEAGDPAKAVYKERLAEGVAPLVEALELEVSTAEAEAVAANDVKTLALEDWLESGRGNKNGKLWERYVAMRASADRLRDEAAEYARAGAQVRDMLREARGAQTQLERRGTPEMEDGSPFLNEQPPRRRVSDDKPTSRPRNNLRTDAVLAANPELLTVLDAYGEPKDGTWSETQIRERVYDAYRSLPTTALKTRREALRKKYAESRSEQERATLRYIGELVNSVLARREKANSTESRASAMGAKKGRPGKAWGNKKAVVAEIRRLRGKRVKVRVEKLHSELGGSGQYTYDPATGERLIEVAVNAASPLGTARHEAMHDLFRFLGENEAMRSVARDLRNATSAPHVTKQLRELLKDHKAALAQLSDPEERAAYAYQFWAEGRLRIGPTGTGVFNTIRKFLKDVFGIVTADQRGEDLLRAFHDGKFANPSVVQEVLQDLNDANGDVLGNKLQRAAPALTKAVRVVLAAAPDRLRRFENEHINELADRFFADTGKGGFIQNKFQQEGIWRNKLQTLLAGTTAVERREAVEQLQAMAPRSKLAKALEGFNREIYEYMREAGVQSWDSEKKRFVPLRSVQSYFTRSWDPDAILRNRSEFEALLRKEGVSAKQAAQLTDNLARGMEQRPGPKEQVLDLGFMPYAPHTSERVLTFINGTNAAAFAKFQHKDLADLMTSYVAASTHRAEYARAFGNSGERITELVQRSGIKDSTELQEISNAVQAMEGSLDPGKWSPETKQFMSGVMTLQNLVVLPLALVSQMIDPIVLAARTGDLRDAGSAYMTSLKRLKNTVTKNGQTVPGEELAEILGIISDDTTLQAMSVAYGATRMSKRMENVNRVFFKYNGMQGWNNSMRIAATAAGERYLIANKGNAEALEELGLTSKDIRVKNGRLDVSSPEVQQAMFRFVDQAVLRPNPAQRPVWMSDPRFLLVAHLKQFTFAMHNVVLKRATRELENGNMRPWGTLMLAAPVILAADIAKFALTGSVPDSWTFKDYLAHAVERSGLLGLGDFGVQVPKGVETGAMPGERLLGPTFEHLMEVLRWISGSPMTDVGDVVDRTVPGARFI